VASTSALLSACGGTDDGRAKDSLDEPKVVDTGSQPVTCSVTDDYEFSMLADFELGSVTGGWYFNNDQCDKCQKAIDRIKEINNATELASSGRTPVDKWGCSVAEDTLADEWVKVEKVQLEKALVEGDPAKNIPPKCREVCEESQTPSAFIKPLPAERLKFNGKEQPRCGSRYAMHVKGGPFQTWGGVFAVQFGNPGLDATDRDGKSWDGISFWARIGPGSRQPIRVELSDERTDDKQMVYKGDLRSDLEGDELEAWCKERTFVCNGDSVRDDTNGCDKFGANGSMSENWHFFTFDFAYLRQSGWGQKAKDETGALVGLDISQIRTLNFLWTTGTWDVWIDDIALYRRKQP
jgi:hypothetical protein